jgi:uncharacterized protein (DUF983 family)
MFQPCGHVVACEECGPNWQVSICFCFEIIFIILKISFSLLGQFQLMVATKQIPLWQSLHASIDFLRRICTLAVHVMLHRLK